MDVERLPRPCRGTKSLLPSPSSRFSSNECGAGGDLNPNSVKIFRHKRPSGNHGKLSIVPKRRALWATDRWAEKLCTNCGLNIESEIFGDVPDAPRFPLFLKLLDAHEKLSLQVHPPAKFAEKIAEANRKPSFVMWWRLIQVLRFISDFVKSITRERFVEGAPRNGTAADHVYRIPASSRRRRLPSVRPSSCSRRG